MVQFLTSLDQNGNISLASLETEMEKLLEYIVIFNPPGEENVSFSFILIFLSRPSAALQDYCIMLIFSSAYHWIL